MRKGSVAIRDSVAGMTPSISGLVRDDSDRANLFRCNRCGATFEPQQTAS